MFKFNRFKSLFLILFFIVCLLVTLGNFFDLGIFSKRKINFGLDFKGGSQLLLKIDFDYYLKEKLEENIDLLKDYFLENKIKALPKIENNNNIKIVYKNDNDVKKIEKYLKNLDNIFNIENNKGILTLKVKNSYINDLKKQVNLKTVEIIKKRIAKINIKEILIKMEGDNKILIQLSGLQDLKELKNLIGKTAKLTFHIVDEQNNNGNDILKLNDIRNNYKLNVDKKPLLSGDLLTDVNIIYNQGKPVINFKFNNIGTKKFAKITRENIGKMLAIVFDDKIITVPRISSEISGGIGSIAGNFSNKEAAEISSLLKIGALLAPINIIEEKNIDAKIDQNLLKKGIKYSIYGLIFLILFLFIIYKSNGIILNILIFINIIIFTAMLSIFNINLTLYGLTTILIIIGISIGINIFIFEKILQKIKKIGDNIYNPISIIGDIFDSSYNIILNINIITIAITTIIFYIFDSNTIRNFLIILIIGLISSLLSNLVYLRKIFNSSFKDRKLLIK